MTRTSSALLDSFKRSHGQAIDLTLRPEYSKTLERLGCPEKKLPCPILVAGTNGKGSTCAFLRAIVEESGRVAHVYTSPHLVRFHERIRIAGRLIEEAELVALLSLIEAQAPQGALSPFEAATIAAFLAFSRAPADVSILEVGLGGRLDATNIVPDVAACAIARLSFDHREYLGESMDAIAREKAGILRPCVPCASSQQPSDEAFFALEDEAKRKGAPLAVCGRDWRMESDGEDFYRFVSPSRVIEKLPAPALLGAHQVDNAGLAIACALSLPFSFADDAFRRAMTRAVWPGRLQRLERGALFERVLPGAELWLDGGHNDSAGEVLACQAARWVQQDGLPLHLIVGLLASKRPEEFLGPLRPYVRAVRTVPVLADQPTFDPQSLANICRTMGFSDVEKSDTLLHALAELKASCTKPYRAMICGSLYLVGAALCENGEEK